MADATKPLTADEMLQQLRQQGTPQATTPDPTTTAAPAAPPAAAAGSADEMLQQLQQTATATAPSGAKTAPAGGEAAQPVFRQPRDVERAQNLVTPEDPGGMINAFSRGGTFDVADKIAAAAEATIPIEHWTGTTSAPPLTGDWSDNYHRQLEFYRQQAEDYAAKHRLAAAAAWGLGTLAGGEILGAGLGAGSKAVDATSEAAAKGIDYLRRLRQTAKVSTAGGAVQGFAGTNDQSIGEDIAGTLTGAGGGLLLGTAGSEIARPIIGGLSWLGQKYMPSIFGAATTAEDLAKRRLAQVVAKARADAAAAGLPDTTAGTTRLAAMPETTAPTTGEMATRLAMMPEGEGMTVADVVGPGGLTEASRVAKSGGPAQLLARSEMYGRGQNEEQGLVNAIQEGVSAKGSAVKTMADLEAQQQAEAAPHYKTAYQANQQMDSPVINKILQTDEGQAALKYGVKRMKADMSLVAAPDKELTAAFDEARSLGLTDEGATGVGVGKGLKLRTLDYAKQGFDDQIGAAYRAGENGLAASIIRQKNALVGELDRLDKTGSYAQARQIYGGYAGQQKALEAGRQFERMSPDEVKAHVADLTPGERPYFRQGAAQKLIEKTEGGMTPGRLSTTGSMKRLEPLFDTPEKFQNFTNYLDRRAARAETARGTVGGVPTSSRFVMSEPTPESPTRKAEMLSGAGQAAAGLATGQSIPFAQGAYQFVRGIVRKHMGIEPPTDPKVLTELAKMLFSRDPGFQQRLLSELGQMKITQPGASRLAAPLGSIGGNPNVSPLVGAALINALGQTVMHPIDTYHSIFGGGEHAGAE